MVIHRLKILPEYFKAQKAGYVVLGTKDLALDVYRRMSELGLIK